LPLAKNPELKGLRALVTGGTKGNDEAVAAGLREAAPSS